MLMPDIGYAPAARIAAGAEDFLRENDYCLIIATYDRSPDWQQNQFTHLRQRGVEGVIALQAELPLLSGFPVVSIEGLPLDGPESMTPSAREVLTFMGRKAALQVVRKIEQSSGKFGRVSTAEFLAGQARNEHEGRGGHTAGELERRKSATAK
jgi:hypothetical protein